MARMTRRALLMGMGVSLASVGCARDLLLLPGILMSDTKESLILAEYPLKSHHKKPDVPVKVVVLVSAKPGLDPDLVGVDRMLNKEIIEILEASTKANEEKVQVLPMMFIDRLREENTNWRAMHPYSIGKKFDGADYVIDVEIGHMTLYKPNSRGEFLQGRAEVSVAAYDLTKTLKDPAYHKDLTFEYPKHERPIETASRAEVSTFRLAFVRRIATDVALKFTAAPADYRRQLDS